MCVIIDAVDIYQTKLDSSPFGGRLDRSTKHHRAHVRAMADLGPELIAMGLIDTPVHGCTGFTVPRQTRQGTRSHRGHNFRLGLHPATLQADEQPRAVATTKRPISL
jgi:hypothetical protein